MSRTNEARHRDWHKTCKCKCRLDASVCSNKQRWNEDKCICKCKELIDKQISDKGFIWNPGNCECECDKSCDIVEYLDYKNCRCRKRIIDKLVEECSKNIDGNEMLYDENLHVIPLHVCKKVCRSYLVYIVLFAVFFNNKHIHLLSFFYWYLKKDNISTNFSVGCLNI